MSLARFSLNDHKTMAPTRAKHVTKPAPNARIAICNPLTAESSKPQWAFRVPVGVFSGADRIIMVVADHA
jgi:hypothetical protein